VFFFNAQNVENLSLEAQMFKSFGSSKCLKSNAFLEVQMFYNNRCLGSSKYFNVKFFITSLHQFIVNYKTW
jgi:hypothetical protein